MVRVGESPRNASISIRTPVAGFLLIPKIIELWKQLILFR